MNQPIVTFVPPGGSFAKCTVNSPFAGKMYEG